MLENLEPPFIEPCLQFTSPRLSSNLLSKLLQFQSREQLCDVLISNEESCVSAHSCVLAAVSPFMLRYISRASQSLDCSDRNKLIVPISTITKMMNDSLYNCMECVVTVIRYIYTGAIGIARHHFDHIVNMSCNLEIEELISICRDYDTSDLITNESEIQSESEDCLEFPMYKISKPKKAVATQTSLGDITDSFDKGMSVQKLSDDCIKKKHNICFNPPQESLSSRIQLVNNNKIIGSKVQANYLEESTKSIPNIDAASKEETEFRISAGNSFSEIFLRNKLRCKSPENSSGTNQEKFACPDGTSSKVQFEPPEYLNSNNNCTNSKGNVSFDNVESVSCKYNCLFCNFKCNSRRCLTKHLLGEKYGNQCSLCRNRFRSNDALIQHIITDHNFSLSYTCDLCGLKFHTRNSLKIHLITHQEAKGRIKCNFCNRIFTSNSEMESHVSVKHCNREKHCDFCNYKTNFSSYLKRHLLKHNRKLISCSFPNCDFQTVWKANLKNHMKVHITNEKAFQCYVCKAGFSVKRNLQRHISLTHNKCKVYTCPKCKYNNKRFDKLRAHYQKVHQECFNVTGRFSKQLLGSDKKVTNKGNSSVDCIQSVDHPTLTLHTSISSKENVISTFAGLEEEVSKNSSDRVVYLNEATGELTFFCDSEGKPLKGVPDVITVHSIGGMADRNNFDTSNSTGVILNEITGELTCIQLNFTCNSEPGTTEQPIYPDLEATVTVLDETTGEITSKHQQISLDNDSNMADFNNIFDTIDFDAMNDDSFDGFDDFDNALFDAEFSVGSTGSDMDKILNEFTGELFTNDSTCHYPLNKQLDNNLWSNNKTKRNKSNSHTDSQVKQLSEIFLDEVTGELTAEFSPLKLV